MSGTREVISTQEFQVVADSLSDVRFPAPELSQFRLPEPLFADQKTALQRVSLDPEIIGSNFPGYGGLMFQAVDPAVNLLNNDLHWLLDRGRFNIDSLNGNDAWERYEHSLLMGEVVPHARIFRQAFTAHLAHQISGEVFPALFGDGVYVAHRGDSEGSLGYIVQDVYGSGGDLRTIQDVICGHNIDVARAVKIHLLQDLLPRSQVPAIIKWIQEDVARIVFKVVDGLGDVAEAVEAGHRCDYPLVHGSLNNPHNYHIKINPIGRDDVSFKAQVFNFSSGGFDHSRLRTRMTTGNLGHSSPGQLRREAICVADDIYGFGDMLHQTLAGAILIPASRSRLSPHRQKLPANFDPAMFELNRPDFAARLQLRLQLHPTDAADIANILGSCTAFENHKRPGSLTQIMADVKGILRKYTS